MSDEIRELAMRLANKVGADLVRTCDSPERDVYEMYREEIEGIVRAAKAIGVREGMMRAADKCGDVADIYRGQSDEQAGDISDALAISIRAEVDKLEEE